MHKSQTKHIAQRRTGKVLNILVLFGFCVLQFGFLPLAADAQIVPPCDPVPGRSAPADTCGVEHLIQLLVNIYNFLLGLAGLMTLLFIVFGGARMLFFSYWEDSAAELQAAQQTVTRAVFGFMIIAMAYLLVNTALLMLGLDRSSKVFELLVKFGLFK
jgi:hypothetical protein